MKTAQILLWISASAALRAQVPFADIAKGPGENWLTYAGDFASTRYSSLRQINRDNVGSLTPKWIYPIEGARRLRDESTGL